MVKLDPFFCIFPYALLPSLITERREKKGKIMREKKGREGKDINVFHAPEF